jgi:hypothetical protein
MLGKMRLLRKLPGTQIRRDCKTAPSSAIETLARPQFEIFPPPF